MTSISDLGLQDQSERFTLSMFINTFFTCLLVDVVSRYLGAQCTAHASKRVNECMMTNTVNTWTFSAIGIVVGWVGVSSLNQKYAMNHEKPALGRSHDLNEQLCRSLFCHLAHWCSTLFNKISFDFLGKTIVIEEVSKTNKKKKKSLNITLPWRVLNPS